MGAFGSEKNSRITDPLTAHVVIDVVMDITAENRLNDGDDDDDDIHDDEYTKFFHRHVTVTITLSYWDLPVCLSLILVVYMLL